MLAERNDPEGGNSLPQGNLLVRAQLWSPGLQQGCWLCRHWLAPFTVLGGHGAWGLLSWQLWALIQNISQ